MPSSPEDHYRAVCRALATESSELRIFLTKVFTNDAEALRIKADAQSSRQELAKLAFSDWVSFIDFFQSLKFDCRKKKNDKQTYTTIYSLIDHCNKYFSLLM